MRDVRDPLRRTQLLIAFAVIGCAPGAGVEPIDASAIDAVFDSASVEASLDAATIADASIEDASRSERVRRIERAGEAAVEDLARTTDEVGADVVVMLRVYGRARDSARALEVATWREAMLPAEARERFEVVLDLEPSPGPSATLVPTEDAVPPNPEDDLGDDRAWRCPEQVLQCELEPRCVEFVELEGRGGFVLTHQALAIVFARWLGCALPVDVEGRRRAIATRLLAESYADPVASELAYERFAMLAELGFAAELEPFVDRVLDAQHEDGCFPLGPDLPCHPHATGVALWTLAHAR